MPYPTDTIGLVFGGALPAGEEWQCGIRLKGIGTPGDENNLATTAAEAYTALATWWGKAAVLDMAPSGQTLDDVRCYGYAAGATRASAVGQATVTPLNGSGAQTLAHQCSIVHSFSTAYAGRTNRARIYLPCLGYSLGGSPQMASSSVDGLVSAMVALIGDLNEIDSAAGVLGGTSGHPVTAVTVDSKIDTQRRRARQMEATYVKRTAIVAV